MKFAMKMHVSCPCSVPFASFSGFNLTLTLNYYLKDPVASVALECALNRGVVPLFFDHVSANQALENATPLTVGSHRWSQRPIHDLLFDLLRAPGWKLPSIRTISDLDSDFNVVAEDINNILGGRQPVHVSASDLDLSVSANMFCDLPPPDEGVLGSESFEYYDDEPPPPAPPLSPDEMTSSVVDAFPLQPEADTEVVESPKLSQPTPGLSSYQKIVQQTSRLVTKVGGGAVEGVIYPIAVALTDFVALSDEQANLSMGELYFVLESKGRWWKVANKKNNECGLVPMGCLARRNIIKNEFLQECADVKISTVTPEKIEKDTEIKAPNVEEVEWGHWQLDPANVILNEEIGEGEFGLVYSGILKGSGKSAGMQANVAIKSFHHEKGTRAMFLREAETMIEVRHEALVKMYGVVTEVDPILIVCELCENGNLRDFLIDKLVEGQPVSGKKKKEMTLDIASGMRYLHDQGYVHRDLAARNVLVEKSLRCKVSDFGLVRFMGEGIYQAKADAACPIRWTAPEALEFGRYTIKTDIYSFGITLWEIWCVFPSLPSVW